METIEDQRLYRIVKSNDLIQKARFDLSLEELKVLAFIFSKVKPSDKEFKLYTFSIVEFCKVCGINQDSGGNYDLVKKTIKGLVDKSFWIATDNKAITTVSWINKAWVYQKTGKIKVRLDDDIQKYIIGLHSNFTEYELLSTLPMSSKYSVRLYEILKSYAYLGNKIITIDDLRQMIGIDKKYSSYKDFRTYVLDKAISEINLYTDIETEYEAITTGKKITKILFIIKRRDSWGSFLTGENCRRVLDGKAVSDS